MHCSVRLRLPAGVVAVIVLLVGLAVVWAAPAAAHARLVGTEPSGGSTVVDPPEQIVLTYNEQVEESFSDVQVFDPSGVRVDARAARIEGPEIVVPMTPITDGGTYTVVFRVIGVDGHPVESRFTFIFEPSAETPPTPTPDPTVSESVPEPDASATPSPSQPTASPQPSSSSEETSSDDVGGGVPTPEPTPPGASAAVDPQAIELEDAGSGTDVGLLASRVLDYVALVVVAAGLVGGLWLFTGDGTHAASRRTAMRRVTAWGGVALAGAAAMVFVFGMSAAAAEPLPGAVSGDLIQRFAGTRFGRLVLLQAVLGVVIAVVAALRTGRGGMWAATGLAVIAAALPGVWGHAGTTSPVPVAVASDWTHVVAAAVWVGGLAVTLLAIRRMGDDAVGQVEPVIRFSLLAGVAVWAVLASGVATALLHIGELALLTGTSYGRLAMAKTALFAVIALLGWLNRTRAVPALRRAAAAGTSPDAGGRALWRFGAAELAVMVLALGVAGGLASSIPAEAEAAARVEFVAAPLTDSASLNVTIDPAEPGRNVLHIYVLGANGQPRPVDGARLMLTGEDELPVDLFVSGPGHYTVLDQTFPNAGEYLMAVEVDLDGQTRRATATVVIQ